MENVLNSEVETLLTTNVQSVNRSELKIGASSILRCVRIILHVNRFGFSEIINVLQR